MSDLGDAELQELYTWVDEIPLSRPKRNLARDFSDGVLSAEVAYHFFPKLVQLHNYSAANGTVQKMYNWNTLNVKVLSKLGFMIPKSDIEAVCKSQHLAAERILNLMRHRFSNLATMSSADQASLAHTQSSPASQKRDESEYTTYRVGPAVNEPSSGNSTKGGKIQSPGSAPPSPTKAVLADLGQSRDEQIIVELREMNEILETKTRKLEQLVRLKDAKIHTLLAKLEATELT